MTSRPTYDDANLILRLYDMRREERMRKARAWFTASFKVKTLDDLQKIAPVGSDENASYRMIVTYWDMVASFVLRGVLNEELFFDNSAEMWFTFAKLQPFLKEVREKASIPQGFMRVEKVVTRTKDGRDRLQMMARRAEAMRAKAAKA